MRIQLGQFATAALATCAFGLAGCGASQSIPTASSQSIPTASSHTVAPSSGGTGISGGGGGVVVAAGGAIVALKGQFVGDAAFAKTNGNFSYFTTPTNVHQLAGFLNVVGLPPQSPDAFIIAVDRTTGFQANDADVLPAHTGTLCHNDPCATFFTIFFDPQAVPFNPAVGPVILTGDTLDIELVDPAFSLYLPGGPFPASYAAAYTAGLDWGTPWPTTTHLGTAKMEP
jgi:hypothetical protein